MQAGQAGQEMGDGAHRTEGSSVGDKILTKVINIQNLAGFLQSFLIKAEHTGETQRDPIEAGSVGWYTALDAHDVVNADVNNFKDFEFVKEKSDRFSEKNLHSKKRTTAMSKKEFSIQTFNRFSCLENKLDYVLSEGTRSVWSKPSSSE